MRLGYSALDAPMIEVAAVETPTAEPAAAPAAPIEPTARPRTPYDQRPVMAAAAPTCGTQAALDRMAERLARIDLRTVGKLEAVLAARLADALDAAGFAVKRQALKVLNDPWRALIPAKTAAGIATLAVPGLVAAAGTPDDLETAVSVAAARALDEITDIFAAGLAEARDAVSAAGCGTALDHRVERDHTEQSALAAGILAAALSTAATQAGTSGVAVETGRVVVPRIGIGAIRQAMAIAGGATLDVTLGTTAAQGSAGGSWVLGALSWLFGGGIGGGGVVAPAQNRPSPGGGVVAPPLPHRVTRSIYETLTWVHDHPRQPFAPHVELHGREVLAMAGFGGYFPGDHVGCKCLIRTSWRISDPVGVQ
jgi:hypothetical protein